MHVVSEQMVCVVRCKVIKYIGLLFSFQESKFPNIAMAYFQLRNDIDNGAFSLSAAHLNTHTWRTYIATYVRLLALKNFLYTRSSYA